MDITVKISKHAGQLLPHQLLISWLKGYKRPNDKIQGLKNNGFLMTLKKGLYIAGPSATDKKPDQLLIANHILGPSYVSVETALAFYGLIPERVYEIASMTTKSSRLFNTPVGLFSYTRLPLPYYSFGLTMVPLLSNQYAMVATPEKAICDKIVTTSGLTLRSARNAHEFFVHQMRIDESTLKGLNIKSIQGWLSDTPKRNSIWMAIKMIESL